MTRFPVIVLFALLCPAACPAFAARPALTWERMHTGAQPSRLLLRLGLTHITRLGYTRDGAQKTDPDPLFPPGLTDAVPLDAEHVLLVRGTVAGRVAFRRRVGQMDAQMRLPRWHVEAFLEPADRAMNYPSGGPAANAPSGREDTPPRSGNTMQRDIAVRQDALAAPAAPQTGNSLPGTVLDIPDAPTAIAVPDGTGTRTYQLDVNDVPGSPDIIVTVRPNLAVSALPVAGLTLPAPPAVWGTPLAVRVRPGTMAVLDDKSVERDAARARLRLPTPAVPEADVTLHVTVTPFVPPAPAPIAPAVLPPAIP